MKKQSKVSKSESKLKKLQFDKKVISNFDSKKVKGGGNSGPSCTSTVFGTRNWACR